MVRTFTGGKKYGRDPFPRNNATTPSTENDRGEFFLFKDEKEKKKRLEKKNHFIKARKVFRESFWNFVIKFAVISWFLAKKEPLFMLINYFCFSIMNSRRLPR